MKNLSLLFLLFFAFSCSKEEKTTSSNVTQRSNSDATWCDELIEGEPTSVTGYYTYPSELISTSPNFKFYVNYNALTVKNRFDIYDGIGTLVASTNAYVMGTGTLTFIVCPDSPLPFRLVVKAYSATKATDKWNVNITCSPYSCIPVDSCCDKVFLDAQWSVDADRPGCCIYNIKFINNSTCLMNVYQNGIKIATVGPLQVFPLIFSKCENTTPITFSIGESVKNPCKTFTTQPLGTNCSLS